MLAVRRPRYLPDDDVPGGMRSDVHDVIPLMTGSIAELYIRPMLPCFGDIDVMHHQNYLLAIPEACPPPTELPSEFHNLVAVCEIIDREEYPGYVYLMLSYMLTEDRNTGTYNAVGLRCDKRWYAQFHLITTDYSERRGPASTFGTGSISIDAVKCMRCLLWPTQATDWPTRHRKYNWPDSTTVDRVVNNGCDVVGAVHHQCRQNEWMNKYQWRLSFSRAEIVLLNSWMPVQQIVYHMLRFFTKTLHLIDIRDSSGRTVLHNYHLKTLILWASEIKPQSWWTNNINVVRICVELLDIFSDWQKNKICPHYFVSSCNLFYNSEQLEIIVSRLVSVTELWLSKWFVNNYLRKLSLIHISEPTRPY